MQLNRTEFNSITAHNPQARNPHVCPNCGYDLAVGAAKGVLVTTIDLDQCSECKYCAKPIFWARDHFTAQWIPIEPTFVPQAMYCLRRTDEGVFAYSTETQVLGVNSHSQTCKKKLPKGYLGKGMICPATITEVAVGQGVTTLTFHVEHEGVTQILTGKTEARLTAGENELGTWVEAVLERQLQPGDKVELEEVVGKNCMVQVGKRQEVVSIVAGDLMARLSRLARGTSVSESGTE